MSYNFYSSYMKIASTPNIEFREDLQAFVDSDFEIASDYYTISKKDRTTGLWDDIGVRLTKPYKIELASSIRDDYYQVIFKDGGYVSNLGDMFEFNDYRYMVIDVSRANSPTSSCIIQRCNVQLKFVANNNSVISATPTYYTIDGIGVTSLSMPTENRMIQLSDDQMAVSIPTSDEAKLIRYSSGGGTRFLLGNPLTSWSCVAIDSVTNVRKTVGDFESEVGIVRLKLSNKVVQNDPYKDNFVLGIAQQRCYSGGV